MNSRIKALIRWGDRGFRRRLRTYAAVFCLLAGGAGLYADVAPARAMDGLVLAASLWTAGLVFVVLAWRFLPWWVRAGLVVLALPGAYALGCVFARGLGIAS